MKIIKLLTTLFLLVFLFYLLLPSPQFPQPLPDSLQSTEPADTETPLRRAYFTDMGRAEVLEHYQSQFLKLNLFGISIPVPSYRLNYPPEDAQTLIRDQTRSTFLEEIVHPFRESLFVNGFEPKEDKDAIVVGGKRWNSKVIVRYVPSSALVRIPVVGLALLGLFVVGREWIRLLKGKE